MSGQYAVRFRISYVLMRGEIDGNMLIVDAFPDERDTQARRSRRAVVTVHHRFLRVAFFFS